MNKYLFIWLFIFGFYTNLFADTNQHKEALLQQLASSAPDTGRLSIIYQLILVTDQVPQEQTIYIDQLLKEAEKQNNVLYKCRAYLRYMFQAYNKYDSEEVNKWMKFLEPLARKEKLYDILFRGKQCVIDMLLINEQYELEEKEAKLMLKEAKEVDNINGQISAYQSLSHVYSSTNQLEKMVEMLQKAIELGPKSNNQLLFGEVVRTMTLVCEEIRDYGNWIKYLKLQDSLIGCSEKQFPAESFNDLRMLNSISFLRYHIRLGKWEKAEEYLHQVDQYYSEEYNVVYKYNYLVAKNYYFICVKKLDKALEITEKLLELIKETSEVEYAKTMVTKAWILNQSGRYREALNMYKQAKQFKDTLSINIINKQANQLQTTYQSDLQILSEAEQHQRIQQIFLILSGMIILILVMSIFHAYHIKRKLMKAERVMQVMMDETEQANKIKERFLSNINMTIRPPLEIIVNESARLASEEQLPQILKEQLSTLITKTSSELMLLINDILLLSKLEAGMMKFMLQEVEIVGFINDISETINYDESASVSVDTSNVIEYKINGDQNYLKQVITSICNVKDTADEVIRIKFEKNGETALNIKFINTQLIADQSHQELFIRNEINRMIIECFGGKYLVDTVSSEPCIMLVFDRNMKTDI